MWYSYTIRCKYIEFGKIMEPEIVLHGFSKPEINFSRSVLGRPRGGIKFSSYVLVSALCCAVVRLFNTEKSEKNRQEYDTILSAEMLWPIW